MGLISRVSSRTYRKYIKMLSNHERSKSILSDNGLDVIFVGNPGTGKSTIGSTLSGGAMKSGLSFSGAGVTSELQWVDDKAGRNIRWADTPGLADVKLAEQSSRAIKNALVEAKEKNRGVKLVFVCCLQAGRVNSYDVMTIQNVINTIKMANGSKPNNNSYTVVFNKVEKEILDSLSWREKGNAMVQQLFITESECLSITSDHVYFVKKFDDIIVKEDAVIPDATVVEDMERMLLWSSPTLLNLREIAKVDTRNPAKMLQEQKEQFQKVLDKQKETTEAETKRLNNLIRQHEEDVEKAI